MQTPEWKYKIRASGDLLVQSSVFKAGWTIAVCSGLHSVASEHLKGWRHHNPTSNLFLCWTNLILGNLTVTLNFLCFNLSVISCLFTRHHLKKSVALSSLLSLSSYLATCIFCRHVWNLADSSPCPKPSLLQTKQEQRFLSLYPITC